MILDDLEAQRERIRAQRFDGQRTAEAINAAEASALETLVALRDEVQADRDEVPVVLGQVEDAATGPTPEDRLLAEMRESRGWDRAKGMLDAGVDLADVIESAGASGDVAMLAGIRAEITAYLSTEALRRGTDPADAAEAVDLTRRRLDFLLGPLLPSELAEARAAASAAADSARLALFEVDAAIEGHYGRGNGLERAITRRTMVDGIAARDAAAAEPRGGTLGAAISRRMTRSTERPTGVGA